jgi:hypothetical protein
MDVLDDRPGLLAKWTTSKPLGPRLIVQMYICLYGRRRRHFACQLHALDTTCYGFSHLGMTQWSHFHVGRLHGSLWDFSWVLCFLAFVLFFFFFFVFFLFLMKVPDLSGKRKSYKMNNARAKPKK